MTDALTYVYCLVRSARRPPLHDMPPGLAGSTNLRALNAGKGVWAIVATVPSADYDEAALARGLHNLDWVGRQAMAHESIVEQFLTTPAVLPMQLFALFTSDERALEHVARDRARIDRILSRIERQLEWGLRLSFDENAARAAIDEKHGTGKRKTAIASGVDYLARKRDLLDVTRVQIVEARSAADRLYRAMAREAAESRRRTSTEQAVPGSRLLLDAAFLVPIRRAAAFRAALRKHAGKLDARGIVVSLTGPWPAYNFVDSPASTRASASHRTSAQKSAGTGAAKRKAARKRR